MKYVLCFLLLLTVSFPVFAESPPPLSPVQRTETYLRNLNTVKADFVQIAQNGGVLTGTFYLDRPGKLRFEYNERDDFIVADGLFIYFYDAELGEQTNAPIGHTLADFLLREDLQLSGDVTVISHEHYGGYETVTLVESDDPQAGSIKLFFSLDPAKPYHLFKWQIVDAIGAVTEIELKNLSTGMHLPASLFRYVAPKQDKPQYNE